MKSRTPSPVPVIVFYISGHGFGHASRTVEVINEVGVRRPDARLIVRTSVAPWLFDATLRVPAELTPVEADTGVTQRDSLHLDATASAAVARAFYADFDRRAGQEAGFLRACGATLVVGDMPPLAFEAAAVAGIPSVAVGNFTWDWIYDAYPEFLSEAPDVLPLIRRAYGRVTAALRLPMWGGFEGWTCPIADMPFVARVSTRDPADVRDTLRIADTSRIVLASFGGLGLAELDLEPLAHIEGYTVVTTGHGLGRPAPAQSGLRLLDDRDVYRSGLRYEDLVRAADVVVTKPGYGIIAECLANNAALLYTSRGHFVEYDVLVAAMPRFLRCDFIGHGDLYAGRWKAHLDAVVSQADPPERPGVDGAARVAGRIVAMTAMQD